MPSTQTEITALATKTKFVGGDDYLDGYVVNVKVKDIIELLRAPAKDKWSDNDEIQHEGQSSNKRAIEQRLELASFLANKSLPLLEPTVALFNENDVKFTEISTIEGDSVGTLSISRDTDDLVAISSIQQLYALYELSQNYKGSPCYDQVMESVLTLTLVQNKFDEASNVAYRYMNRQFAENQMQDFLVSPLTEITNFILETDMLRSETEKESDGTGKLLVNTKSNSLPERSLAITTKKCIEGIHQYMMEQNPSLSIDDLKQLADDLWFEFSQQKAIQLVKKDNKEIHKLREDSQHSLVFKPIGLTAVFRAAIDLVQLQNVSTIDAFERIFAINLNLREKSVSKHFLNSRGRAFSGKDDIEKASIELYNAAARKKTAL
ncbi:hypothetical protein [Vibrio sp. D431a]|uniref:hypothetical protein n=1 Tax=Vibrio sp. D431a TaxID=2837388 RepID=UPI002556F675|nr:hypothetical protein [Vibrio sp. D431a]MDK9790169.1 hypothetical protein [Vibrio sp. D431a]